MGTRSNYFGMDEQHVRMSREAETGASGGYYRVIPKRYKASFVRR